MRSMKMLMFPCGMMTRASIADERDSIPYQLIEIVRRELADIVVTVFT
jgi:hypothetical protein